MAEFPPTAQQSAIYKSINAGESIFVDAKAGTGKSTTVVAAITEEAVYEGSSKEVLSVAFNSHIKKALETPLKGFSEVKTFHGLGYAAWSKYLKTRLNVAPDKTWDLTRAACKAHDIRSWANVQTIAKAAIVNRLFPEEGIIKPSKTRFPDTPESWMECGLGALEGDVPTKLEISAARMVVTGSIQQAFQGIISFDEMQVLPLAYGAQFDKYERIYIDESQDVSPDNIEMIRKSCKTREAQIIAVGDPNQAIYGFRGADTDAVDTLVRDFNLSKKPLTICWRCDTAIIEHAQELVPEIEARPGAAEGEVTKVDKVIPSAGDLILGRTNGSIIKRAFELIQDKHNIRVLGHDIAKGIKKLIKDLRADDIPTLLTALEDWKELQRLNHADRRPTKFANLMERAATIESFVEVCPKNGDTDEVLEQIDFLFARKGQITMSTIHRAKGAEANTVWVVEKAGQKEWMLGEGNQEENLDYVTRTRAKHSLKYLED